jgi:hypothetical protein
MRRGRPGLNPSRRPEQRAVAARGCRNYRIFILLNAAQFAAKPCKVGHSAPRADSQFLRSTAAATGDEMSDRKDDAQKQFAKLQRAEDGKKAMAEYEAEAVALRAKTARLRALRMARDAEVAAAAPVAPVKKKGAKGTKATKGAKAAAGGKASLSDWLEEREGSGHKN